MMYKNLENLGSLTRVFVPQSDPLYYFQHKIGYKLNSACAGDTPQILARVAPTSGSAGSANLMVSVKLCSDNPCCYVNEKLGILQENLP